MDNKNFTILPFYVLSIGLVVAVFLLFYFGRQLPVAALQVRRNIPHALACLIFAGTLIVDVVARYGDYSLMSPLSLSTESGAATKKVLKTTANP